MKAKLNRSTLLLFAILLISATSWAQTETIAKVNVKSPINQLIEEETSQQIPVITATQLNNLQMNGDRVTILDTRVKAAYDIGHIKSAKYLGTEFSVEKVWMLNRNAPVVVYGDDVEASQTIGKQLLEKGFTNVNYLNGSLTDLEQEGIIVEGETVKSDRKSARHNRKK
jgi:rhodanese-related sulfurtransferase